MKIKIVSVGKIKEKYIIDGINEFSKRLSKFTKLELVEVADEKAPENLSDKDIDIIKEKEADRILARINNEYLIVLEIEGINLSSEDFAKKMQNILTYEASEISFVIGGSLGLSQRIISKANMLLSFSKLTFPHQLMKLILLEQIYRALKIINNEPYHK